MNTDRSKGSSTPGGERSPAIPATEPADVSPHTDERVSVSSFIVKPTGYDDLVNTDHYMWCLEVTDGQSWGWSVRRYGFTTGSALNRKGEWIEERRGSGNNKARRWSLDEALRIALAHVDRLRINGCTAAEASARVAARLLNDYSQAFDQTSLPASPTGEKPAP